MYTAVSQHRYRLGTYDLVDRLSGIDKHTVNVAAIEGPAYSFQIKLNDFKIKPSSVHLLQAHVFDSLNM
jgi:hypothetical protein